MKCSSYQIDDLVHLIIGGIWTEIFGLVCGSFSHLQYPGILFHGHLDVRIGFVVLQKGVVPGLMLLYEIVLKHQSFKFRIHHYVFEAFHQTHHLLDLYGFFIGFLEILLYPVLKHLGLSHIDYFILGAMHQVHARKRRQFFKFFIKIKFAVISH